jgi:hypothetical protein
MLRLAENKVDANQLAKKRSNYRGIFLKRN